MKKRLLLLGVAVVCLVGASAWMKGHSNDSFSEKDFESYYEQALQKNDSAFLALLICYLYCRDN